MRHRGPRTDRHEHDDDETARGTSTLWLDASAGIAGDMLLGALLDAGASPTAVQDAIDAVVPGAVRVELTEVERAGLRAAKAEVSVLETDSHHRSWSTIRGLLQDAELAEPVRALALAVFARLAEAEGGVHGVAAETIHFHEVGALDAIADVVGCCAGVVDLDVAEVVLGTVALGSGRVRAAHGVLPVPAPAVLQLSKGWRVEAGGADLALGELATPTGLALATTLASSQGPLPAMTVHAVGIGAGTRERADRANVVRIVLGSRADRDAGLRAAVQVEASVDDLDPRLWPDVIAAVMEAGAWDAWLSPTLGKKGRPGHVIHALGAPAAAAAIREAVLRHTSSIGVRQHEVLREALDRIMVEVQVAGRAVPVKVCSRGGVVVTANPEYDVVATLARQSGRPVRELLAAAQQAAAAAGLVVGAPSPQQGAGAAI